MAVAVLAYAFGPYFWIGASVDPGRAASLATPLDERIPFVAGSIWIYAAVYVLIGLPAFVVESPALFRRVVLAYLVVITVCLVCFLVFPISGAPLRPALEGVDASAFVLWGLRLNYGLDPPVNLFPSMHLAGATIAAFSAWQARRAYGALAFALVVPVAISVCTVKQHYWLDAAAGVLLAAGVWAWLLRGFLPPPGERPARGPGSLVAFVGFLASVYAALYAAFRAGLEPWTW